MKLWLVISAFLVNSCSTVVLPKGVYCVSKCGALLRGSDDCEAFQDVEDKTLKAFARYVDWNEEDVCEALSGWLVIINGQEAWYSYYHDAWVMGITHCDLGVMELGKADFTDNSYTHEAAHVYECTMQLYEETTDHANWDEKGIYKAVSVVKGRKP